MLLVAIETLFAVAEHRKVAADTLAGTHIHMREWAVVAVTAPSGDEVDTKRSTFRCWVVREITRVRSVGTVALQEVPTDSDLGGVVLIRTSQSTTARTCSRESRARFVHIF